MSLPYATFSIDEAAAGASVTYAAKRWKQLRSVICNNLYLNSISPSLLLLRALRKETAACRPINYSSSVGIVGGYIPIVLGLSCIESLSYPYARFYQWCHDEHTNCEDSGAVPYGHDAGDPN